MKINKYIDHTLLSSDATLEEVKKLCNEAKQFKFASVCVNPYFISDAKAFLENSNVKVTTVIGFPLGANATNIKLEETKRAIKNGVDEIDVVINISALKDKKYDYVLNELKLVRNACKNHILKVIVEVTLLNDLELKKICNIVALSGADFIKTSTGFSKGHFTLEDIKKIKKYIPETLKIKASGGVKTKNFAMQLIDLGVMRIGCSKSLDII